MYVYLEEFVTTRDSKVGFIYSSKLSVPWHAEQGRVLPRHESENILVQPYDAGPRSFDCS